MSNQLELVVEERVASGKQVKRLRKQGIVPGNLYGQDQPSVSLQMNGMALQRLLDHGGSKVILLLTVGSQPAVPVLIKQVERNRIGMGEPIHVDFLRVAAAEKLRTSVRLHFINEAAATSMGDVMVSRPLNEVMVECLPADFPTSIPVDLSNLREVGAVIRVGDLAIGAGVTILTDHHEMVAGLYQKIRAEVEKVETEAKPEAAAAAPNP